MKKEELVKIINDLMYWLDLHEIDLDDENWYDLMDRVKEAQKDA